MTKKVDVLRNHAVKIQLSNGEQGSGFLYFFEDEYEFVYILTAKHCLLGSDFQLKEFESRPELKYFDGTSYHSYSFNQETDEILTSPENQKDSGILKIPKSNLKESLFLNLTPPIAISLANLDNGLPCIYRGFPAARVNEQDQSQLYNSTLNDILDHSTFRVSVDNKDNHDARAINLLSGISGSGMLVIDNQQLCLIGILHTYLSNDPIFVGQGIAIFNEILHANGLKIINIKNGINITYSYTKIIKDLIELFDGQYIDPEDCKMAMKSIKQLEQLAIGRKSESLLAELSFTSRVRILLEKIETFKAYCLSNSTKSNRQRRIIKRLLQQLV